METSQKMKVAQFSGEEFLKIAEIIKPFLATAATDNPPKCVIFMGGIAAGKTTIRRSKYAEGYTNFEFGEILHALEKAFGKDNQKLKECSLLASSMLLGDTFENKKNLVIEIIGGPETEEALRQCIDMMTAKGYDVTIEAIYADVAESYQRHLKAVAEDPDYYSAHFTEALTVHCLQTALAEGDSQFTLYTK